MNIGFTGHRNKNLAESTLEMIFNAYPDAQYIHGGAVGFDSQVDRFFKSKGKEPIVIRPDYQRYLSNLAPLIRNKIIVNKSDLIIACYDGRNRGGTYMTINYAKQQGKQMVIFNPDIQGMK